MNMYYKSVNRGLSFTKPGLYSVGLLLLIGMVAVATGINGLYVFLSAGMGGFVISGLISEKAMTSARVKSLGQAVADAGSSFPVGVTLENRSAWFAIYEMETVILIDRPRFKLIAEPVEAPLIVRAPCLPAKRATAFDATCRGLPRGVHETVNAVQKTRFPFGILEKFKVVKVAARLVIAPAIDPDFLAEVRTRLATLLAALEQDREFFSHRSYQARDPRRDIDWRKSAAKPVRSWVIKQYRVRGQDATVRIDADWRVFASAPDAAAFERRLSLLRTLLRGLTEVGKPVSIDYGGGVVAEGADAALESLAGAPAFAERAQGPRCPAPAKTALEAAEEARLTLAFLGDAVAWPNGAAGAAEQGRRC